MLSLPFLLQYIRHHSSSEEEIIWIQRIQHSLAVLQPFCRPVLPFQIHRFRRGQRPCVRRLRLSSSAGSLTQLFQHMARLDSGSGVICAHVDDAACNVVENREEAVKSLHNLRSRASWLERGHKTLQA